MSLFFFLVGSQLTGIIIKKLIKMFFEFLFVGLTLKHNIIVRCGYWIHVGIIILYLQFHPHRSTVRNFVT